MNKSWAIIHLTSFDEKPFWIMSNRQIEDDDMKGLLDMQQYNIDLTRYGFGYEKTGMHFGEVIRVFCTKKEAAEYTKRLNNGEDPFFLLFEQYNNVERGEKE